MPEVTTNQPPVPSQPPGEISAAKSGNGLPAQLAHRFRRAGNGLGSKALQSALLCYFQKTGQ